MAREWSRGLLEEVAVCPACGSQAGISREYRRRDDFLVMPDTWRYVRCAACKSVYLNPRPDRESLPRAYTDYYTHYAEGCAPVHHLKRQKEAIVNGYLRWRFGMQLSPSWKLGALLLSCVPPLRMKLDVYGRHIPRSLCKEHATLLDVGCGNGAFLQRAMRMGLAAEGCEPDPSAVAYCVSRGLKVVHGDAFDSRLDDRRFDIITLNHVIEHVAAPLDLLRRLRHLLAPAGRLWIALPNPQSLGLKLFGPGWKGLHPPFHLVLPHQEVLGEWLRQTGFSDVTFIRRGAQSPGLWRESMEISSREGTAPSGAWASCTRALGDVLSTFSVRYGEETICSARNLP